MLLGRVLIAALIIFEVLNLFGILNFTLDFSWLGLLVTSIATLMVVEAIYYNFRRKGILLPLLPYLLAGIGLWFDALGDVAHLYGNFAWYDQFMHLLGGGIVMSLSLAVFSNSEKKLSASIFMVLIAALAFTALFGSLYEIEEYLEDQLYHGRQLRLGDGPDTASDLMWNLIGGVGIGIIYLMMRKNNR